jgi:hypothetical protein
MSNEPKYWHIGDQTQQLRKDMRVVGDILAKYCRPGEDTEIMFKLRSDSCELDEMTGEVYVPIFEIIDSMYDAEGDPLTPAGGEYLRANAIDPST